MRRSLPDDRSIVSPGGADTTNLRLVGRNIEELRRAERTSATLLVRRLVPQEPFWSIELRPRREQVAEIGRSVGPCGDSPRTDIMFVALGL
jgi:hypothetical protein